MNAVTEIGTKKVKGRLDSEKQEKVINRKLVDDKLDHLISLKTAADERKED